MVFRAIGRCNGRSPVSLARRNIPKSVKSPQNGGHEKRQDTSRVHAQLIAEKFRAEVDTLAPAETRKIFPAGALARHDPRSGHADVSARSRTRGASAIATARAGKSAEIGRNRANDGRPKTAAPMRPESRRLRRNGRFDRKRDDRPKRKKREARGLKIEIGPLYVDKWAQLHPFTIGPRIAYSTCSSASMPAGCNRTKSTNVR